MKTPFLLTNLKSNYCKVVFLISLIIGYMIIPKEIYTGKYIYLAIPFIILFSFTLTCTVRHIKEKIVSSKKTSSSVIGMIANIIGISTLQVCGIASPTCGASIGIGILSAIFPNTVLTYLKDYAVYILILSILIQIYSLYSLNCLIKRKTDCHVEKKEGMDLGHNVSIVTTKQTP